MKETTTHKKLLRPYIERCPKLKGKFSRHKFFTVSKKPIRQGEVEELRECKHCGGRFTSILDFNALRGGVLMNYVYHDGGRAAAGYKGNTGDCGVRALAIATGMPYIEAYALIAQRGKDERFRSKKKKSSPRDGVWRNTFHRIMKDMGWVWTPCMSIGSGCHVHMRASELPLGKLICSLSRHFVAVIDGTVYDTYDPRRGGDRCVYGVWSMTPWEVNK